MTVHVVYIPNPFSTSLYPTPYQNIGLPLSNSSACIPMFLARKKAARMFVIAMRKRTTEAKTVRETVWLALSQMKIQARFKRKLMDSVMVNVGVQIVGFRYTLPDELVTNMVATRKTRPAASQKKMRPQMEKVVPFGVMYSSNLSLMSPTVLKNTSGTPDPDPAKALKLIIRRYV